MVTHVVVFRWAAGTAQPKVVELGRALDVLAAELREIVTITHGPDLQFREGNGDYALVATFGDRAAWDAYQSDARHKAFVQEYVLPIQASRVSIQF